MIFSPICRFTGYSGGFICFCDYIHQGIYGNLWTTCAKRKVPRSHSPFWQEKNARENPACKDTRASAQGGVCHRRSAGNRGNFQLFQCYVASQPGRVFFFFNFFLVCKHNIVYSKTLLQDKKTFSVFMIASDPTPPLDKYFVQQIHKDLHLPLP